MQVGINGQTVAEERATVPILSHAMSRGSTIFEVLDLVATPRGRAIFRAGAHAERFLCGAEALHMELPLDAAEFVEAMKATVRANGLERGGIKAFAYWGEPEMALIPHNLRASVAIFCYDFERALGVSWNDLRKPASACVTSIGRARAAAGTAQTKAAGNYVTGMLARWEAVGKGADDAILLDDTGHLAEGPLSSVFVVRGGVVRTARLDGVLAGVTRDSVIAVTRALGIALEETDVPGEELAAVDEAFYTGTHIRVKPIRSIDGRSLAPCPGPVTARIQQALEAAYDGADARYAEWLDYVE